MPISGFLELKAELLTNGICTTAKALKEVGDKYKEQNHGLFGWDFEDHAGVQLPDDFVLPDKTLVQFRKNSSSPYRVSSRLGELILSNGREDICNVKWIPRPEYYWLKTSHSNSMVSIGQTGG